MAGKGLRINPHHEDKRAAAQVERTLASATSSRLSSCATCPGEQQLPAAFRCASSVNSYRWEEME